MASSTAPSVAGSRNLTLSSSFSRPDRAFLSKTASFPARDCQKKAVLSVRAMGVVKFQGTHMREKYLTEMIEKKVTEAKEVCEGDGESDECKVAWDEVEEVSQAKADLRRKMEKQDPLEPFCRENPDTEECRIYED